MGYNVWSSHEWRSPLLIGFLLLKGCYGITIGQVHKSICIKKTYTTTHLLSTSSSFWMGRRLKRAQNSASSTFRFHDQNSEQKSYIQARILKCRIASSFTWKRLAGWWPPSSFKILAPTLCLKYLIKSKWLLKNNYLLWFKIRYLIQNIWIKN